jgi:F-type H+-transporting ATPase subunit a
MAEAIFHIKDSYYFEIPKALWQYHFSDIHEVPGFLPKEAERYNLHPTLKDYEQALNGKILLYPQPFGELKNLYEKESGFLISKFMILEFLAAAIIAAIFIPLAQMISRGGPPRGRYWNLFETTLVFLRDYVARPAIGKHDAHKFVPLLWTMFFFVLMCNLLGLVPWAGSATGAWSVTLALACVTFLTVFVAGMAKFGPIGFWFNQIPHMDLPWHMSPLKLVIFVIEVAGLLIRHAVLSVRLLANMVAGHMVLLAIVGLAVTAAELSVFQWGAIAVLSVLGSVALSLLELFVAFLQAYIFTFLSALFIGAAVHHH